MFTASVKAGNGEKLKRKITEIKKASKRQLRIGFFDKATYSDGTRVAYIAYLNEFGGNNPPRPFLKRTVKNNFMKWTKGMATTLKTTGINPHGINLAFNRAGLVAVGDVKRTIKDWNPNDPRPNSAETIANKKLRGRGGQGVVSADPNQVLIDTGRMISAVMYEVKKWE